MEKPVAEEQEETEYRHKKLVRLRDEDLRRLQQLAKKWGVSEAGVFRKALGDAANEEGLE
jgi:hypothetical protein